MPRTIAWFYKRAYEAANYRLRHVAGGQFASACRPTSIMLLFTEHCNARCVHCDIWKNKGREDNPTVDQWKTFLHDIATWLGPVQVTITGGEALLRPTTPELIEYAVAQGLFVEMLTHGFWTDRSRLERVALADPWRITMSIDGIGTTHSKVRGRENFWELASGSLEMLSRLRRERNLHYNVLLKTVVMEHNLDDLAAVAEFAHDREMEVFYQPIERNYNTPDDPLWYEKTTNWPRDPQKAVARVRQLIAMKQRGAPIANSFSQLEVMTSYFLNPADSQEAVKAHTAHEKKLACSGLTMLQVQANGDVRICANELAIGSIKEQSVRELWNARPHYWESGCCLGASNSGLTVLQ